MGNAERMKGLLQAIGVTVEVSKLIFDNALRVGFTPQQALELSKQYIHSAFTQQPQGAEHTEE